MAQNGTRATGPRCIALVGPFQSGKTTLLEAILARTGAPVIFDATHSVQQPGGQGTSSGGERAFVPVLARAATAVGIAGIFIETHQDPDHAPSDGPNMIALKDFGPLLGRLMEFDALAKRAQ